MKKEDYYHLTSKYSLLSDYEKRYRKELISFINEAFEKHDNVFELKCTTHDSWKEAGEDDEFDAMNDLPVYIMVDNQYNGLDEVYITRAERTGKYGIIYIDGYDYSTGEFVKDYYTNSHIDDLQSIAYFINAVLEQETEDNEEEKEDAPTSLCMEDYEKGEALMRKDGFFSITSVHRDDLTENGFDASAVTDAKMKELAKRMCDEYLEQMFFQSLQDIAESMGIPKKYNKVRTTSISFGGTDYFCRIVRSNEGEDLIVGTTKLMDALHPGSFNDPNEGFASREAERIYNDVFYFVSPDELLLSEKDLIERLKEDNPDFF